MNIPHTLLAVFGFFVPVSCRQDASIAIVNPEKARLVCSALAFRADAPPSEDLSMPLPKEHSQFTAQSYYPQTYRVWCDAALLQQATGDNTSIRIERGKQRGKFYVNGKVAMDFPVSTGKHLHTTPLGKFRVRGKDRHHVSNIYGVSMPCFMRLTDSGIGLHVGDVYRHPVSHGCIRLPRAACEPIFKLAQVGMLVEIVD